MAHFQLTDEAALKVLEILTKRVGARIAENRTPYLTVDAVMNDIANAQQMLGDGLVTGEIALVLEALMQQAVVNVIAVVSMVAGDEATADALETSTPHPVAKQVAEHPADRARRLMIERARQSGIAVPE